jgi:hypothetical protein
VPSFKMETVEKIKFELIQMLPTNKGEELIELFDQDNLLYKRILKVLLLFIFRSEY